MLIIVIAILILIVFYFSLGGSESYAFLVLSCPTESSYSVNQIKHIHKLSCGKNYDYVTFLPNISKFKINKANITVQTENHNQLTALFNFLKNVKSINLWWEPTIGIDAYDDILSQGCVEIIETRVPFPKTYRKCQKVSLVYDSLNFNDFKEINNNAAYFYSRGEGILENTNLFDYLEASTSNILGFETNNKVPFVFNPKTQEGQEKKIKKTFSILDIGHSHFGNELINDMLKYADDNEWEIDNLAINDNKVHTVPDLKNVKPHTLTIAQNPLQPGVFSLDWIKNLGKLYFYGISENFHDYKDAIGKLTNLHSLHLRGNNISNLDFLKDLTLTKLNVSKNNLTKLPNMPTLKYLSISDNKITYISGFYNLLKLKIGNNPIRMNFGEIFSLAQDSKLQKISLEGMKFKNYYVRNIKRYIDLRLTYDRFNPAHVLSVYERLWDKKNEEGF